MGTSFTQGSPTAHAAAPAIAGVDPALHDALQAFAGGAGGQAVLLDGAWGVGKTHYVKATLMDDGAARHGKTVHYLSLYDLENLVAVESALATLQLGLGENKALVNSLGSLVGGALQSLGDAFKDNGSAVGALAGALNDVVRSRALRAIGANHLVILDDIERYRGHPVDILAIGNRLAEHQQAAVLLIGWEAELEKNCGADAYAGYARQKEKSIGQTYEFSRDIPGCVDLSIAHRFSDERKEFAQWLTLHRKVMIRVCTLLRCHNLRALGSAVATLHTVYRLHAAPLRRYPRDAARLVEECFTLAIALKQRSGEIKIHADDLNRLVWDYQAALAHARAQVDRHPNAAPAANPLRDPGETFWFANFTVIRDGGVLHPSLWKLLRTGLLDRDLLAREIAVWDPRGRTPFDTFDAHLRIDDWELLDRCVDEVLSAIEHRTHVPENAGQFRSVLNALAQWQREGLLPIARERLETLIRDYCDYLKSVEPVPFTAPQNTLRLLRGDRELESAEFHQLREPLDVDTILLDLQLSLGMRLERQRAQHAAQLFEKTPDDFLDMMESEQHPPLLSEIALDQMEAWLLAAAPAQLQRLNHILWSLQLDSNPRLFDEFFYADLLGLIERLAQQSPSIGRRYWYTRLLQQLESCVKRPPPNSDQSSHHD